MRIGVLGNVQVHGIAASLRALLPDAQIIHFEASTDLANPALLQSAKAALATCDHVLAHELGAEWGDLAAGALGANVRRLQFLPVVEFAGFHPDCIVIETLGGRLSGPTGVLHSRIALVGYLTGHSVAETLTLYNRLVFAKLGYLQAYSEASDRLAACFKRYDIDIETLQTEWVARGSFMHAPDRPKINVLIDLARLACAKMNIVPTIAYVATSNAPDRLAQRETHPVLPDIAAAAGVASEGAFRAPAASGAAPRSIPPREFISLSFRSFEAADQAALLEAEGVAEAMAALRLTPRPPVTANVSTPRMALLTWHGTVMRQPEGAASPRHLPLSVSFQQAPPLLLEFPSEVQRHGFTSPILGGVRVGAARADALVSFSRDGRFFCPERDNIFADFTREGIGDWEGLLPISMAELGALSDLVSHDWRLEATGERVAHVAVRLVRGFVLWFSRWRIDLTADRPTAHADAGDGRKRVRLMLGDEMMVAVATYSVARAVPAPVAATLALGQRQLITGERTLLSLPMVGSNADRRWLYDAYKGPLPVPAGQFHYGRVLCRMPNVKLRFDEAGGVHPVPDEAVPQAIARGTTVLAAPPAMPMRRGWVEAALRLFALWPYLPGDAKLLLAPAGLPPDIAAAWQELGLARAAEPAAAALCVAEDLVWLGQESAALLPAEVLSSFRDRARSVVPTSDQPRRIFVHGLGRPARAVTLQAMQDGGLELVDLGVLSPLAQMAAFAEASWVVGTTGPDLAGLVFCAAGTRVIELAEADRFDPQAWMVAGKIGLNSALLPGAGEFNLARFEALGTMLANREL